MEFEQLMEQERMAFVNAYFASEGHKFEVLENTHLSGMVRKPQTMQVGGNVREKEKYIFLKGKRVATGRSQRFSQR